MLSVYCDTSNFKFHWTTHTNLQKPSTYLAEDLTKILESGEFSDMTIGEKRVHSHIINLRCPYSDGLKSLQNDVLDVVLKFIYSDKLDQNLSLSVILQVLVAAQNLKLTRLEALCERAIPTLSVRQCVDVIKQVSEYYKQDKKRKSELPLDDNQYSAKRMKYTKNKNNT
eukprot:TRINITY_DN9555_c0_g1_i1.p1 TRINITY_DN9555_c0_g1~~TRINITY_DN9555_c0_g1_i1.p1  ORF type:complete len:169 (+),score=18.39 TRINITY_DN9555_c0_g1_i1:185-691(+)